MASLLAACTADGMGPNPVATVAVSPQIDSLQVADTVRLVAVLRDANGRELTDRPIAWTSSDSTVATVTSSGLATARRPGVASVTATSQNVSGVSSLRVLSGPPVELDLSGLPTMATAGVPLSSPLQVVARDANGYTSKGFTGDVTVALGTNPTGATVSGNLTQHAVDGVALFSDIMIDKSGSGYTLQAVSGSLTGVSQGFGVAAGAVSGAQSALAAAPSTIVAGVDSSTVTVTARDAYGNPISGAMVVLAASGTGNTIAQPGPTDANGIATGFLRSTLVGDKSVSARIDGDSIVQTAIVTVTPGSVSGTQSTVTASPSAITASTGAVVSTITVTAKDELGNPISGATVILAATGAGNTLTQPAATTDASGTASGTLSSTVAGAKDVSATIAGTSVTQAVTVTVNPGGLSAAQSSVIASPTTIPASSDSSPATITVTAKDSLGNPIPGATVVLAATGTGNLLTQPGGPTDSGGMAVGTLSSTDPGAKVVSATIGGVAATGTATVTVTPGSVSAAQSTVTVSPDTVEASQGTLASTITVTAKDGLGNPIPGATVVLTATGTGNTLTQPGGVTDAGGMAAGTLSSTDPGTKVVSATIGGVAVSGTATVTVTPGSVSGTQSTVTASPSAITASTGAVVSTITVTAKDELGNPISGATVILAATGAGNTLTQPTATTDASGTASGTLSSTVAGAKDVSATIAGTSVTQAVTVTVNPGGLSAAQSGVIASPTTIPASSGSSPATIEAMARDSLGNPIPGATVVLAATGTGNTVTQPGPTDSSGIAVGTLSSTDPGAKVVSATINQVAVSDTVTVTVTPGSVSAAQSTVTASPDTVEASQGTLASTITVTARDELGNPIPEAAVQLSSTGGGNTLIQPAGPTDTGGVTTGSISSTVAGSKIISATIEGTPIDQRDTITVAPAASDTLAYRVQPTNATSGTAISPAVQVEIRDRFGNLVPGATNPVTLTLGNAPGASLSGGGPIAAVNGVATFPNVKIDLVGTGYTLNAAATGLHGTTSNPFDVTAGAPSASQSSVSASPASITAGSESSTITVTVRDNNGNPVSGATVTLSATGSGNTITQPSSPSGPNGVATGSLSSTVAEVKTVKALVADSVTLNQKPSVAVTAGPISTTQSSVTAAPAIIVTGSETSSLTVIVKDAYGNPVSNATVQLTATGTGNTLTQPAAPTDATGMAMGTLSSSVAETKAVSAQADGLTLSDTASVTVTASTGTWVMVGAGDMTDCSRWQDDSTGALISRIPGEVFTLGDNTYPNGTTSEFNNCYAPAWGGFKARTHPIPGNHEYNTKGAAPYFAYFGAAAGTAGQGYYSYDVGSWHIIVLNGEISTSVGSAQETWLQSDLAAHQNVCTMAMVHEPLWSSTGSSTGSTGAYETKIRPLWDDLYAAGADVMLNGHRHNYERIAPIKPDGSLDLTNGIRTFIVGTGGESTAPDFTNIFPYSEVREAKTYGVLKLTLSDGAYSWEFIPITGETFTDSGSATCH